MKKGNNNRALDLARNDLAAYGAAMMRRFKLAPHHRRLVEELEAVERGQCDRLCIFMPPRHGKSLIASTLFPAWYLGRNPEKSIIASSYGQELASDFGRRVRNYVSDPLHRQIFPLSSISDDSNAVHRFHLRSGGAYFAAGAGGPITGRGANLLLIDDPIKSREQANSAAERRSLQSWFESTAYPRLEDAGAIVVISTRWHEDDLPGWLLKEHAQENWRQISLPAIAEPGDLLGRPEGAPLWAQKFPLNVLERIREAIGSAAWTALYQQRPAAAEGAIFKRDWWRKYSVPPTEIQQVFFSIDSAFKAGAENDYSVVEIWAQTATGYYLLHVWRGHVEFPKLKAQTVALADIWRPTAVLVEDKASGQSLIQVLRDETRLPILPVAVAADKVTRAHAVTPLIEAGRVYLPESAPWLNDFVDELSSFPAAAHDDQVDALTQALSWARQGGSMVEHLLELQAALSTPSVPEPIKASRDVDLWSGYDSAPPPRRFEKRCRHCQREIGDDVSYVQEPGGYFTGGTPLYSHSECARRAMAGLINNP